MATLVIGGTGFIGSRIAGRLVERKETVVCLHITTGAPGLRRLSGEVTAVRGDVTNLDNLLEIIKEHRIDRIANLAYVLNAESDRDPHLAVRVNALGMSNVFEAARLLKVKRVVYPSSIGVYGDQSLYGERLITEDDRPSPNTLYGAAKLFNDYEAALYRSSFGLSIVGIRLSPVFGHGRLRGQGMWAAAFASNPALGLPVEFPFSPEMRWSMIYVEDAAELFVRVLLAQSPKHGVYNSGGDAVRLGDLAAHMRGLVSDVRYDFGTARVPISYLFDSSRAQSEFDWRREPFMKRVRDHVEEARNAAVAQPAIQPTISD